MVRVVVAARANRVSPTLPVIVSDYLSGYLLGGDGRRPPCHQTLLDDCGDYCRVISVDSIGLCPASRCC